MATANNKPVHVTLPAAIVDDLDAQVEARVVSRAFLVEKALVMYLPTLPALPGTEDDKATKPPTGA